MCNTRIVPCEKCNGDGGWSDKISFDPFRNSISYSHIACDVCEGTGEIEIELEPIEMEDL